MKHKNGLKEATAKLKAQGFKAGGEVKAEMTKKNKKIHERQKSYYTTSRHVIYERRRLSRSYS